MSRSKGWHKEDIKAAVRKRGTTLRALSVKAGLCRDAAGQGLSRPYPGAQRAIAAFLDVPLNELWPQWYDQTGQRIITKSIRKASPKRGDCHCKKSPGELA